MKILRIGLVIGIILLILLACSPGAIESPPTKLTPKPAASQFTMVAQESWEQEWDRVKMEARREGEVVLAGNIGPQAEVLKKVIKEKYGINPEFIIGRGSEIAAKMIREQNAGLYLVDVIFSTTMTVLTVFKPEGRVERIDTALILPEVKDPRVWFQGEVPWVDREKQFHLAFLAIPKSGVVINTQLVNINDIKSYYDLLDPRWKGKILINDPMVTGAGNAWFTPLAVEIGRDYFAQLLKQEPVLLRDQRLATEWLARGKYSIYLGCDENTAAEFIQAGAPIIPVQLKEGAYITQSNGALSKAIKAPHPNAAKVVINWAMSREGGRMLSEAMLGQSARVDVVPDFLPPFAVRQPGIKYVDAITEDYQFLKTEYIKVAQDIFGPYMRK